MQNLKQGAGNEPQTGQGRKTQGKTGGEAGSRRIIPPPAARPRGKHGKAVPDEAEMEKIGQLG